MLVRLDTNIYKCKNVSIWVISYLRDTKDYYVFPHFPISATASVLLFKNRQTKIFKGPKKSNFFNNGLGPL